MRKIFTLLILLLLLPVTALAADMNTVYVGGVELAGSSTSIAYATTNENGEVITEGATADNYNIMWDGSTLTLKNAYITNAAHEDNYRHPVEGAAIGVANSSGAAELTIELESDNTIEDVSLGIWVYSSTTGYASLTIMGNGSLTASVSANSGILVQSNDGNATLSIENAEVTTTSSSSDGVLVRAKDGSNASLTVNGGSLTATGKSEDGAGIRYTFGGAISGSGKPSLTVSNSAIVKASSDTGGITSNSSPVTPSGTGIVFNNGTGTVYGSVTLQEDLTIGEDESLTIPEGSTLNTNGNLTNNGTIVNTGGTLNGEPGGTIVSAPTITTESLPEGTVGQPYTATLEATGNNIAWSSSDLPTWLTLDASTGVITGTPTTAGTYNFTVKAENSVGSDSKQYTLNIKAVSVTGVKLNKTELALFTDDSEILTATIEPDNATNQAVTWESSDHNVATVDNGKVSAVAAGEAIITVTTADGGKTATCQVKVTQSTYSITADITTLDFGSAYIKYSQAVAQTVTITNNGNQDLTLNQPASTKGFEVGNLSTTSLPVNGTATFTVQPKAALEAGTYKEEIVVSGSNQVTLTISATFNVRNPIEVEPSGSTNLSFTTDRDEFTLTATVRVDGELQNPNGSWTWTVEDENVVERVTLRSKAVSYSTSRQTFTIKGTGTTTITATYDDGIYRGSVDFTVRISKPTPPDPISYYNIYVEDVCDGVEVSTSKQVVREGGSVSVYVKKDTVNYTFDNFKVYYKRSYYGGWEELKEGTQPGEYPIKNIWTHIYIKALGAEEKEDPTGIESIEGVKVYTKDGSLYVQTPQREQVIIVSMSGAVVKNEEQIGLKQYHGLQPGIYIVRIGDRAYKLRLN